MNGRRRLAQAPGRPRSSPPPTPWRRSRPGRRRGRPRPPRRHGSRVQPGAGGTVSRWVSSSSERSRPVRGASERCCPTPLRRCAPLARSQVLEEVGERRLAPRDRRDRRRSRGGGRRSSRSGSITGAPHASTRPAACSAGDRASSVLARPACPTPSLVNTSASRPSGARPRDDVDALARRRAARGSMALALGSMPRARPPCSRSRRKPGEVGVGDQRAGSSAPLQDAGRAGQQDQLLGAQRHGERRRDACPR